jgi:hypothetical protein
MLEVSELIGLLIIKLDIEFTVFGYEATSLSLQVNICWYIYGKKKNEDPWQRTGIQLVPLFQNIRCFSFFETHVSRYLLVCRLEAK